MTVATAILWAATIVHDLAGRLLCASGVHLDTTITEWRGAVGTEVVVCERPPCLWAEQYRVAKIPA